MDTLDGFFSGDDAGEGAPPALVRPVENPRLPADGGLASLGLLMDTTGKALALVAVTYTIVALMAPTIPGMIALVALLSVGRSWVHARAGRQLVDEGPRGAGGLGLYASVAGVHTALCVTIVALNLPDPPILALALAAVMLMAWPLLLLLLARRPDIKAVVRAAHQQERILVSEDRGLTALGILMVLGGVMMLAVWGAGALALLISGALKLGFFAVISLMLCGLFGVRAWFGFQAGRVAARTRDPQPFMQAFDRYNTMATISIALSALLIVVFGLFAGLQGLLGALVVFPALAAGLVWPRAIRQYADRMLPEVTFTDDPLPAIRRPRDAGLTGLGVVLLGISLPGLFMALVAFVVAGSMFGQLGGLGEWADYRTVTTSAVAFVAGWCLFTMNARFQPAAVLYGVIASGLAVWVGVETIGELQQQLAFAGPQLVLLAVVQSVLALTLPLATLWLALRHEEVGDDAVDADLARAFD